MHALFLLALFLNAEAYVDYDEWTTPAPAPVRFRPSWDGRFVARPVAVVDDVAEFSGLGTLYYYDELNTFILYDINRSHRVTIPKNSIVQPIKAVSNEELRTNNKFSFHFVQRSEDGREVKCELIYAMEYPRPLERLRNFVVGLNKTKPANIDYRFGFDLPLVRTPKATTAAPATKSIAIHPAALNLVDPAAMTLQTTAAAKRTDAENGQQPQE